MSNTKILYKLSFIFLCFKVNAQTFIKSDFIGTWNVDSIASIELRRPVPKSELPEIEHQKKKFKNSSFVFKVNGIFYLQTDEKKDSIQTAFWEVNDENNVTIIRIWKNKDKIEKELLIILPVKKNDKIEFWIGSSILKLIVNKYSYKPDIKD